MSEPLPWRIGVEIEALAPVGRSREDLAQEIARAAGGRVVRFFHPQSEPSKVPGTPIFESLTLGFEARDADDRPLARFVDDVTLQDDLDKRVASKPGWFRIVSDEGRLLRLLVRHADPSHDLKALLTPFAELYGVVPTAAPGGVFRVADLTGASLALGAPLLGERERPCELITPPLDTDHEAALEALLAPARRLGFSAPAEGATHLHFDATPFVSARAIQRLVRRARSHGGWMRRLVQTNPRCRRLGPPEAGLVSLVESPGFLSLGDEAALRALRDPAPSKYVDVNIKNLVMRTPGKFTVEMRIFPVHLEVQPILDAAWLCIGLFREVLGSGVVSASAPLVWHESDVKSWLSALDMPADVRDRWLQAAGK